MTSRREVSRSGRGYLLLEAMIGGAVLAVVLAIALTFVASARETTSLAAKRQIAAGLARAKLDELMSSATLSATTQPFTAVDPVKFPGVLRGFTVTNVTAALNSASPSGVDGTVFEIIVEVQHPRVLNANVVTLRSLRRMP